MYRWGNRECKKGITCLHVSKTVLCINLKNINRLYNGKSKQRSDLIEHTYSHEKPYTVSFIPIIHDVYK